MDRSLRVLLNLSSLLTSAFIWPARMHASVSAMTNKYNYYTEVHVRLRCCRVCIASGLTRLFYYVHTKLYLPHTQWSQFKPIAGYLVRLVIYSKENTITKMNPVILFIFLKIRIKKAKRDKRKREWLN